MIHPTARPIVIRASRETALLVAAAVAMTFALSHAVHTHQAATALVASSDAAKQEWAGGLTDLAVPDPPKQQAMTSASLVVPATALTPVTLRQAAPKSKPCDLAPCAVRASAPLPPLRQKPEVIEVISANTDGRAAPTLMHRLNPLNHIPDVVRRPFDYAGNTFQGWLKRL